MPGMMEGLTTVNSFLRTLIALVVIGGVGTAGWFGYTTYNAKEIDAQKKAKELAAATEALSDVRNRLTAAQADNVAKDEQIQAQVAEISKLNENVKKLETALYYLKVDHRVARFTAVDQTKDDATGEVSTLIEFVELNDEGQPIDTPRQFRIRGDTVYIDGWVVQFEDKYVEAADLERGTSLLLFKRIFGSGQKPDDGFPLDEVGSAPRKYARGGRMSDFEKKIWDDFWNIASDSAKAEALGIKAAHGVAPYVKVKKGSTHRISLRASGQPFLVSEEAGGGAATNGKPGEAR
jgi:hypothetical protein